MNKQKTQAKKRRPKSTPLGKEILAALSEFTEALKSGEVADHLRQRGAKSGGANHKPKARRLPSKNGKKARV